MNRSFPIRFTFQTALLLAAALGGGAGHPAFAEDIHLSATVDKNQLILEDTVEFSVTVHGVQNPPMPQLPSLSAFRVRSSGTQSSTQIINSQIRVSKTYKYLLIPKSVGQFVIGPATMELAGTTYKSDPITLTVDKPQPGRANRDEPAFVEAALSIKNPFVNEQVVYTFKLFRRVEAQNLNLDMPYDDTLFRKEDLGNAKRYSQVINGIAYDVHEISVALFPLKPGKAVIPPSMLEVDLIFRERGRRQDPFSRFFNDPFFGGAVDSRHKILTTPQAQLNVRALPEAGKPANFRNLVGRFGIGAQLGKADLEAGDTTTLTVTVSGTGNLMDVTLPEPDLKGQFKVYPDQPLLKQTVHGNQIGGEKIFKFALVPFSAGRHTVPSIPLTYFDPEKKTYVTVQTSPIDLKVRPGAKNEKLNLVESGPPSPEGRPSVKILARDILPIHTRMDDFADMGLDPGRRFYFAMGMLAPILVYFFSAGYINYRQRMKYDTAYFRSQGAYNLAKQKLDRLAASPETDSRDFVRELSQIMREYIGNKLNLQGTAFTSTEVEAKLKENQFGHEQVASMNKLLEKCESMQYAPVAAGGSEELIGDSLELLKELEKQA